jgi:hypothetical protein
MLETRELGRYDGALGMYAQPPREPDGAKLEYVRHLVATGRLDDDGGGVERRTCDVGRGPDASGGRKPATSDEPALSPGLSLSNGLPKGPTSDGWRRWCRW